MIRHGETEANAAKIMAGSLDSPLNDNGRRQAREAKEIIESLAIKPRTVVHSQLSRARDTACILNESLNAPIHEDHRLAELHAGDWEGQPYAVCSPLLHGWEDPPNGEPFSDFTQRLQQAKSHALATHDGPVMIVSHGGVFRGLGMIYGLQIPGVFKNCQLYEFLPQPEKPGFPWAVWNYRIENGVCVREPSHVYDVK